MKFSRAYSLVTDGFGILPLVSHHELIVLEKPLLAGDMKAALRSIHQVLVHHHHGGHRVLKETLVREQINLTVSNNERNCWYSFRHR